MTASLAFEMSVLFTGSPVLTMLGNPNTLCVTEQEYAHDVVQMEFWAGDVNSDSVLSGTPVYIRFGRAPIMRSFYGYVNHATRINNATAGEKMSRNALCVTVIGASWPLKQTATTAYTHMTSTQIVEQIAAQFNLAARVEPHPVVWPVKQQAGLSYWEFCVQLMQEIGYTFYCNGIELVAVSRQTNPQDLGSLIAVFDYRKDPSSLPVFNPTLGSNNPLGGQLRTRQLAGIDPRTNQVLYSQISGSPTATKLGAAQEQPPFVLTEMSTVENQLQLNAKLAGSALLNQFYLTASAVGAGIPSLSQGGLIFVRNANGAQNGLWYTTRVEHHMSSQTYVMNLDLGRDSLGSIPNITVMPQTTLPPQGVLSKNKSWVVAA